MAERLREIVTVDVSKEFAEGAVPILYIGGRRDRLVGARVMAQMKRVRPTCRPGCSTRLTWSFNDGPQRPLS
jgi:hypothetical protein